MNMKTLIVLFIACVSWTSVQGQISSVVNYSNLESDSTKIYEITTRDGNTFIGHVEDKSTSTIFLETSNLGLLQISIVDIKSMVLVESRQIVEGEYWADHPQSTRYFWQPNGYGVKQGEGYYQNVWILFNQFSVGVTDNFLLGGGFMPLFLFGGGPTPFWLTPKFSIPLAKDKVNLAAGALLGYVVGGEVGFGIPYGALTLGSRDRNVSFGLGYGYAGGSWASAPTITISSLIRTGKKSYFMTENYLIGGSSQNLMLIMVGGRRIVGKKTGIDFGAVVPFTTSMESMVIIPWLGITVAF